MKRGSFVKTLSANLRSAGFDYEEDLSLGPNNADLYGFKHLRWNLLPYDLHCNFFQVPAATVPDRCYVLGLNSVARSYTNRFKTRRPRYLRWTIPITVTFICSANGFIEDAVAEVRSQKQPDQVGHVNLIVLFDESNMQLHRLSRFGILGRLPLKRIHEDVFDFLRGIEFHDSIS